MMRAFQQIALEMISRSFRRSLLLKEVMVSICTWRFQNVCVTSTITNYNLFHHIKFEEKTKQTKKQNCVRGHLAHTGICFVIFSSTLILLDTDKLHSKTDPTFKTKMYCHSHLLRELTPPRVVHLQVSTIFAHHFTNLQNMIPNRCTTKVHMKICV